MKTRKYTWVRQAFSRQIEKHPDKYPKPVNGNIPAVAYKSIEEWVDTLDTEAWEELDIIEQAEAQYWATYSKHKTIQPGEK